MAWMRTRGLLAAVLIAAVALGGCSLSTTPYNGRESCSGVGGSYTSDGRCVGGSGA